MIRILEPSKSSKEFLKQMKVLEKRVWVQILKDAQLSEYKDQGSYALARSQDPIKKE